jgi:pyruvate dehydrogenase E2 component (dihydrolipoamide acetyltransferase)
MIEITMPRLSDTMEVGTIVTWLKQPGDSVERGEVVAEIETDKATMDLESFDHGVLDRVEAAAGATVPIGTVIAFLRSDGEESGVEVQHSGPVTSALADYPRKSHTPSGTSVGVGAAEECSPSPTPRGARPKASPLARAVARERGIDLNAVAGGGPGGRIVRADIDALGQEGQRPPAEDPESSPDSGHVLGPVEEGDEDVGLSSMRAAVARRMSESARSAPHFYATVTFAAEKLLSQHDELRRVIADREDRPAPSLNDLMVKAVATALGRHRALNASFDGDRIRYHHAINVGVAVALDGGLIVPVLRDADTKTVTVLAAESRELSTRARAGKLQPEEFRGGTFTVSNLGMFGIEQFTAIINPPEAAILAVGSIRDEPVVRAGAVVPGKVCTLTLSSDHRVVDGAIAARFLADLKVLLEEPLLFLV